MARDHREIDTKTEIKTGRSDSRLVGRRQFWPLAGRGEGTGLCLVLAPADASARSMVLRSNHGNGFTGRSAHRDRRTHHRCDTNTQQPPRKPRGQRLKRRAGHVTLYL